MFCNIEIRKTIISLEYICVCVCVCNIAVKNEYTPRMCLWFFFFFCRSVAISFSIIEFPNNRVW